jgi:hypothetical protein
MLHLSGGNDRFLELSQSNVSEQRFFILEPDSGGDTARNLQWNAIDLARISGPTKPVTCAEASPRQP